MSDPIADDPPRRNFLRRNWGKVTLTSLILVPLVALVAWTLVALNFSYSEGERFGYVQKLSKKGWACKTWEGELAMSNVPGSMPEKFLFSVRNDSVANLINAAGGQRVGLSYQEHRGIPTSCFGETNYFVDGVQVLK